MIFLVFGRLFNQRRTDTDMNPDGLQIIQAIVERSLAAAHADQMVQFERHGHVLADEAGTEQASLCSIWQWS